MTVMVAAHLPEPTSVISPYKVSHYGVRTTRIPVLRDWYITVLGLAVVFESDDLCLLTFDNEHHRLSLLHADAAHVPQTETNGIEHGALTYASLSDLISTYERLKKLDIKPYSCVNHGPTTSIYYSDPDGNHVELLVENFPNIEALKAWFVTGEHERHPHGVPFDPDKLATKFHTGVPVTELLKQGSTD
jgi:catechol-2,3-dioxygenase